ncbi:MAG: extracellular solute-binding protein, partial [Pseudomonadota bacterium]|nr:extracellular solute-binding protein [Pseudomonadota bacterium]
TGSIAAATAYNGDTLSAQEYNPNIKFVLPKEGALIWVDHWVVYSNSQNRQLAYQFLNFINQPEIAAQNAEYVYTAPANTESLKYVSQEFLDNPVIFPSSEQLKNSEVLQPLDGRTLRTRSRIFNKIVN